MISAPCSHAVGVFLGPVTNWAPFQNAYDDVGVEKAKLAGCGVRSAALSNWGTRAQKLPGRLMLASVSMTGVMPLMAQRPHNPLFAPKN